MIKGILFDKDGTLIEFESTWHSILNAVFKVLDEMGYPADMGLFKKHAGYRDDGFEKESAIQYLSTTEIVKEWARLSSKREEVAVKEIIEVFEQVTSDDNIDVTLLTGTVDALNYLTEKKYCLGIATADTMASCRKSLQKVDILGYFDFIGADDGVICPKPHAEMGELFCKRFNLTPDEVLVVGDSIADYEFAKAFGGHFIGIRSTYSNLESSVPDEVKRCDHIAEIIDVYQL
ncbi:HAD family hydrolase [Fusibacter sp. 3D3]|uniref:HAD family hydrolase n=1 Tax=Fusibacter sp. 3D3 TaxID=1048380 RepID=UPI000852B078|nr:HAD family hydrolase [Fusibacter sp. 3D3]GAU79204.1 haloacid dehalogenase-like family [Fusibacter sp. 3D3]